MMILSQRTSFVDDVVVVVVVVLLTLLFGMSMGLPEEQEQDIPSSSSLLLKSNLGCQNVHKNGYLIGQDGKTEYDLTLLEPYDDLLAPTMMMTTPPTTTPPTTEKSEEGNSHDQGLLLFENPILRASFDNGKTIVQAQKEIQSGTIVYAEIRYHQNSKSTTTYIPDTYFVKPENGECNDNELLVFTSDQIDYDALSSFLNLSSEDFDEEDLVVLPPLDDDDTNTNTNKTRHRHHILRKKHRRHLEPDFVYERGDGTSLDCNYFKVVKVGIIYDAEFCSRFGGETNARDRIMMIVAAASVFYENDMCVKLQLTDIYTPDTCSTLPSGTFESFRRDSACGNGSSETFIRYFKDWMNRNKRPLRLDPDAAFHAFTGVPHRGTLGCAYVGTVCRSPELAYGVEYMRTNNLPTQSITLAHEIGHNLNARHLTREQAGRFRYIMSPTLNNANDGFSTNTIGVIHEYLNSRQVSCDTVEFPSPPPTELPTPPPSPSPTLCVPSEPVSYPPKCISASRDGSFFKCYDITELMGAIPGRGCPGTISCEEEFDDAIGSNDRDLLQEGMLLRRGAGARLQSNDSEDNNSFESNDCNRGCIVISADRLCVDGGVDFEYERNFRASYAVASENGGESLHTVTIKVERTYLTRREGCDIAQAVCIE